MQYNTTLPPIRMREYGRNVQRLIEQICLMPDREERLAAAREVANTMVKFSSEKGNSQEKQAKIWNHMAYISSYKLDIDYPVEITRED